MRWKPMTIIEKPPEQLAKEDLIRQTLDEVIWKLETFSCGTAYRKAFDRAMKLIREMKP